MAPTTVTFGYDGKLDTFTAPVTGVYTLDAYGAQGGTAKSASYNGGDGGNGGETKADFYLTAGTVLNILVGQKGGDGFRTYYTALVNGGGGGGTFVATTNDGKQLGPVVLVSAGGGGGGAGSSSNGQQNGGGGDGGPGSYNGSSSPDNNPLLAEGYGGFGGGSGGGGSIGIGTDGRSIFLTNDSYSTFDIYARKTMFTGGNGGNGGRNNNLSGGSGGTGRYDYYAASNIVAKNAVNTGNGSVLITYTPVTPTATPVVDFKKDPAKYMVSIRDIDRGTRQQFKPDRAVARLKILYLLL